MFVLKKKRKQENEVNASSTADIAFLLLIFFLVTAQIQSDKGIFMILPPADQDHRVDIKERNVLNLLVNSNNELMVDEELTAINQVKSKVKQHIDNHGRIDYLSEKPSKAIISVKTDRGTNYETYMTVLDQVKGAYNELRAAHLNLSLDEYNGLKKSDPKHKEMLEKAKEKYPMMISDAQPSDVN